RRRPAAGRSRRQGAPAARRNRGSAHRLRLVQPHDARVGREGAARGARLRAPPCDAGRHVPAHAARRERRAPRALSSDGRRPTGVTPAPPKADTFLSSKARTVQDKVAVTKLSGSWHTHVMGVTPIVALFLKSFPPALAYACTRDCVTLCGVSWDNGG